MIRPAPDPTLFPYTTLFRSLAAAVGVRLIVESPVRTIETNVKTTELVLAAACKKRKKVFVASTSEVRSEEHTSELQSHSDLVCRLLLEKKNIQTGGTRRDGR